MKRYLILIAAFCCASPLMAETDQPPRRNPFWPVGYLPPSPKAQEKPKEESPSKLDLGLPEGLFTEAEKAHFQQRLTPSGIMAQGQKKFAIIQGDLLGEGDITRVKLADATYKFRLKKIESKSVLLRYEAERAKAPSTGSAPKPQFRP